MTPHWQQLLKLLDDNGIGYSVNPGENVIHVMHEGMYFLVQPSMSFGVEHLAVLAPVTNAEEALRIIKGESNA